jgi:hypothetical protein
MAKRRKLNFPLYAVFKFLSIYEKRNVITIVEVYAGQQQCGLMKESEETY